MKTLKKLFVALTCVAAFSGAVFAQTSKTADSTSGLFGTDIDNFMDVTDWSSVQVDNLFLMADSEGIGLAKQFKNFYASAYFGGEFDEFESSNKESDGTTSSNFQFNKYNFGLLFGFSNMAIKAYFSPSVTSSASGESSETTTSTGSITKTDDYAFTAGLQYGISTNLAGKPFSQSIAIEYAPNIDHRYTSSISGDATVSTESLTSVYSLNIGSNTSWQIFSGENFTNTVKLDFIAELGIIPETKTNPLESRTGAYQHNFELVPAWITKYENDRFKFGAKGSFYMQYFTKADAKYVTEKGVKEYTSSQTVTNMFAIVPQIDIGAQFQIAKPVVFNVGTSFDLPALSWSVDHITARDSDGTVQSETFDKTFAMNSNGASSTIKFVSGFAVNIGQHVTVDASYNILSQFDGLRWNYAGTDLWANIGKIFFTNMTFGATLKF